MEEKNNTPCEKTELSDDMLEEVAGGAFTTTYNQDTGFWEVRKDGGSGCQVFRTESEAEAFIKKQIRLGPSQWMIDQAKKLKL